MELEKCLQDFFEKHGIEYYASCSPEKAKVINPRRLSEGINSIVVFLMPYYTGSRDGNISLYAHSRDYHIFTRELEKELSEILPDTLFGMFSDTSPFDEIKLACDAGLGFIGKNRLLINEKYGSYCFIGEIAFSERVDIRCEMPKAKSTCLSCGRCVSMCPGGCLSDGVFQREKCLSEITQKKRVTDAECEKIASHKYVWGCDICQNVCPYNEKAGVTPIDFFRENLIRDMTPESFGDIDDGEFSRRAYSWRGRDTLSRNISLHQEYNRNKEKNQ